MAVGRLFVGLLLAALVPLGGCTEGSGGMGPDHRMNATEGGARTFSWAYYTDVVASGDGVVAAWMDAKGDLHRDAMTRHSSDRGATWGTSSALNEPSHPGTVSVQPVLSPLPGDGNLLAIWQARKNEAGQKFILARRSTDFGKTWEAASVLNSELQSFLPRVATREDGAVLVAFTDERNTNRDIFVNRSLDGGKTWLDKDVRVDRLRSSESGGPAVAIGDGQEAYVAWEERPRRRKNNLGPHLMVSSSGTLGTTWSPPVRVDDPAEKVSPMWPQLAAAAGNVTLVWSGGLSGASNGAWIWLSTSSDRGVTWSAPKRIYEGTTQPLYHLRADGDRVYLAWHGGEAPHPGVVFFNASNDGGKTWIRDWSDPVRVNRPGDANSRAFHPRLAIGQSALVLTWQEALERVMVSVSRDGGATWSEKPTQVATAGEKETVRYPQVAVSGDDAYVLWERWADKDDHVKSLADMNRPLPRDVHVRRVSIAAPSS